MVTTEQPSSAWRRGLHLGKLGVTLTGSCLGYQLQNLFLDPAEHPPLAAGRNLGPAAVFIPFARMKPSRQPSVNAGSAAPARTGARSC